MYNSSLCIMRNCAWLLCSSIVWKPLVSRIMRTWTSGPFYQRIVLALWRNWSINFAHCPYKSIIICWSISAEQLYPTRHLRSADERRIGKFRFDHKKRLKLQVLGGKFNFLNTSVYYAPLLLVKNLKKKAHYTRGITVHISRSFGPVKSFLSSYAVWTPWRCGRRASHGWPPKK